MHTVTRLEGVYFLLKQGHHLFYAFVVKLTSTNTERAADTLKILGEISVVCAGVCVRGLGTKTTEWH